MNAQLEMQPQPSEPEIQPPGFLYAPLISQIINRMGITHLLDYYCGNELILPKHLKVSHKITYQAYDPSFPKFSAAPLPAQMVVCLNPLVSLARLDELVQLTEGILFAIFNGPWSQWMPLLWDRFDMQAAQLCLDGNTYVVAYAMPHLEAVDGTLL